MLLLRTLVHKYLFESLLSNFDYGPRIGIAESYGNSMSDVLRDHYNIFHSVHQPCTCSSFSAFLRTLIPGSCFLDSYPSGREMVSHCVLICISLMTKTASIFSWACEPFLHLLGWNVYSNPFPIFKLSFFSSLRWVGRVLYLYWLHQIYNVSAVWYTAVFSISVALHFLRGAFWNTEVFCCDKV